MSRSPARSPSSPIARSGDNFRRFDPSTATVVLFEGGDEILPTFGDRLSGKATQELEPARASRST